MSGHIRFLQQDDLPRVYEILRQHTLPTYAEPTTEYVRTHLDDETHCFLVYETDDGSVVAFSTAILYSADTPSEEFHITHPSVITYPEGPLLLLKHNYVDSAYQGAGVGTKMVKERIQWGLEVCDLAAVFSESWVKAAYKSSDELLEKLGFVQAYHSPTYYEAYGEKATGVCSGCDTVVEECQCAGAIYIHRNPAAVVDAL